MLTNNEILIEYVHIGVYVKVSAIHVPTNTEVSIVGDGGLPKDCLDQVVMKKLSYILEKRFA